MAGDDELGRGRESFRRQAWADAYACLSAADRSSPLDAADLELLATSAYLVGRDSDSTDAWSRALTLLERRGEVRRAARCAFWLAFELINAGEMARAAGWAARGQRLLEGSGSDGVEHGLLCLPAALAAVHGGDPAEGLRRFADIAAIGDRDGEHDLMTLGRMGQGQALIVMGRPAEGLALLDEAMAAVSAGEVSPLVTGVAYCAVVSACYELYDLRRAREWTSALSHWCAPQPDLVPYRGQCLVHRSQIMTAHGLWSDALAEARRACERLAKPPQPALGLAIYQRGELHRLRGEFTLAEQAFREANHGATSRNRGWRCCGWCRAGSPRRRPRSAGRSTRPAARWPGPGGCRRTSRSCWRPATSPQPEPEPKSWRSRAGASTSALRAVAGVAMGAVWLAEGDARAALEVLRRAWRSGSELDAPYEAARSGCWSGWPARALGDEDGAALELDAARWVFTGLGAARRGPGRRAAGVAPRHRAG